MTGAGLTMEIEDRGGIQLVRVSGPLDSMTHDEFKGQLDPLLGKPHVRLVLDCGNLTYINSRGLTLLAHYQRTAAASLSFFGIAALNARIVKSIEMLGMTKLVRLYPTVEEALRTAALL